ncbi:hypothetical protein V1503_19505 [Bacillus sp. SCS-151]
MTKLEQLLNKYYATEELSLSDHMNAIQKEVDANEFNKLLHWLNKEVQ